MHSIKRTFVVVTASALLAAPAFALTSQDPPQRPPAQAGPPPSSPSPQVAPAQADSARAMKAQGELVKVDAEAKVITVKTDAGAETEFSYDDATEVAGGREGAAGLATKQGSKVTVTYKEAAGKKTATKIEVKS